MNKVSSIKYQVSGRVVHGDHYGSRLGFPTANLDRRSFSRRKMKIRFGVYAGWATVDGHHLGLPQMVPIKGKYPAAIVIGPLDKHHLPKIEAHLIGFKGNLYGKRLSLYLSIYLRPFRKFKSEEELKRQIKKDIKKIRELVL